MNSWKIASSTIAVLLCGCASTIPSADMSLLAPPTSDKASVYVFQATSAIVSENVPLFVDEEKIGALSLRSYTWFQCEPGVYKISIGDALVSHRMIAETRVALAAGDIVYLKYVLNSRPDSMSLAGGFFGDVVSGKQVSEPDPLFRITEEEAGKLMERYALVGNTVGQGAIPQATAIAQADSQDIRPKLLKVVNAEYPEKLRKAGIRGRVIVEFFLDRKGRVVNPVAVESPHPELSRLAVEAVSKSVFTPGIKNGVPVNVRMQMPVTFGDS
ncbi:MAG TPA: TonB family protein [Opitutaceae bacterium]|nr:TonB family protein [Opitutaceae bacterium]